MSTRLLAWIPAALLAAGLAAPVAAAPARVSADLSAQASHHSGAARADAALIARRGSYVRVGVEVGAATSCASIGMTLTDLASGAALHMPLLDSSAGAALTRAHADALALRAQRSCDGGVLSACGWKRDEADAGGSVFQRTLGAGVFGSEVVASGDGGSLIVTPSTTKAGPAAKHGAEAAHAAYATAQYVELVASAGTPYYAAIVAHALLPQSGALRASVAVWLPEDMPIGAYQLHFACGYEPAGEPLPLVVLLNPYDLTTAEVAPAELAALTQAGRADVIATPGLRSGFALSPPDQAAIDTLLELLAAFPLAARRHPALIARLAADGGAALHIVRRASYKAVAPDKESPYDQDFVGGETSAVLWKAAAMWSDATGHLDLWGAQLGPVGDGTWPYEGAARVRVRREGPGATLGVQAHTMQDSFSGGHAPRGALTVMAPGAIGLDEAQYTLLDALAAKPKSFGAKLGNLAKAVAQVGLGVSGNKSFGAKLGNFVKGVAQVGMMGAAKPKGFGSKLGSFAKGVAQVGLSAGGGSEGFDAGTGAYISLPFEEQLSPAGVVPSPAGGVWAWTGGDLSDLGDGRYGVTGRWTFDDAYGVDSGMVVSGGATLPDAGAFLDAWKGELGFLAGDSAADATRFGASVAEDKGGDPLEGITLTPVDKVGGHHHAGVPVIISWKDAQGQPASAAGDVHDTGSLLRAYRVGDLGHCRFGKCFCHPGMSEALLRAAGIPTRAVTNLDSAHEKAGFAVPPGLGPSNAYLVSVGGKDSAAGLLWWDWAAYTAAHVAAGGSKEAVWNFHVWNELALKARGEAVWNFHVWTEAWLAPSPGMAASWAAFDATPQESGVGALWGVDCASASCGKDPAVLAAAQAIGVEVEALLRVLGKPAGVPREVGYAGGGKL